MKIIYTFNNVNYWNFVNAEDRDKFPSNYSLKKPIN